MIILSAASLIAWIRLMRALSLSASLGPLVLMFVKMFNDVFKLLIITGWISVAFASAIYLLFHAPTIDAVEQPSAKGGGTDPVRTLNLVYGASRDAHSACASWVALQGSFEYWQVDTPRSPEAEAERASLLVAT